MQSARRKSRVLEWDGKKSQKEKRKCSVKEARTRRRCSGRRRGRSSCIKSCAGSVSGRIVGSSFTWNFLARPGRFKASIRKRGAHTVRAYVHVHDAYGFAYAGSLPGRRKNYPAAVKWFCCYVVRLPARARPRCFSSLRRDWFPCNQRFVSVTSTLISLINSPSTRLTSCKYNWVANYDRGICNRSFLLRA